jgi:hypothetical protein
MIKHKKEFGVYHWDTFDNETFLVDEFDTFDQAKHFVVEDRYKGRTGSQGADKVDIVNSKGDIVEQFSVR